MTAPKPTTKQRLRWVWWRVYPGIFLALGLATIGFVLAPQVTVGPEWVMWVWSIVALGVGLAWAIVEYARGGAKYHVSYHPPGKDQPPVVLSCIWGPEAVRNGDYRTPAQMRGQLLHHWWIGVAGERGGWKQFAEQNGLTMQRLLDGVQLRFIGDEPDLGWYRSDESTDPADSIIPDVDEDEPGIQSYGQSWPGARYSVIYAPKATDLGTAGHELDLQAWHAAFPDRRDWSERAKVKHLRNIGVK